ncbi:MAG: PBP1A family penicillin-binding protein [Pseudomonadota bacterium]|nr:PBP1A family penicillin-binding protein [Pseudomonadota bacterium]
METLRREGKRFASEEPEPVPARPAPVRPVPRVDPPSPAAEATSKLPPRTAPIPPLPSPGAEPTSKLPPRSGALPPAPTLQPAPRDGTRPRVSPPVFDPPTVKERYGAAEHDATEVVGRDHWAAEEGLDVPVVLDGTASGLTASERSTHAARPSAPIALPTVSAPVPPGGGRVSSAPIRSSPTGAIARPTGVKAGPPPGGKPPGGKPPAGANASRKPPRKRRGWFGKMLVGGLGLALVGSLLGAAGVFGVGWYYSRELPTVEALAVYRPPTVTVVYDQKGRLMGEIYEKRRYVVELETIPPQVRDAFLSAEDAGFYEHDGVDYMGIVRAVLRNAAKGRKAQGASTITQQVARNFLLSNEKTYTRKIKEILLAWRVEETFDKDHILYLYLNQIYLGSGSYGVEAAARVYFGKHVGELDVAEAAMIAGLPQRPSDYSPHRHFEKAKARQQYVLDQMVDNGKLTRAEADAAYAKPLEIVERTNEFLLTAPWFTENVRRYLVETYGSDKVLNEGLVVETTCDLELQQKAQQAVTDGVTGTDEKVGWRGATETLEEGAIAARIAELANLNTSVAEGARYQGVVMSVEKKQAVVALGEAEAIVPLAWTEWAYKPNASRNSKYRKQDDLTAALKRGDVVTVEIKNRDFHQAKPFEDAAWTGKGPYAAAELYQSPEVQGALYSYRLTDGAVLAMVGGVDFKATEFNRATQASRQVGSTFKPIVYAAAIESKRFTAGTIVQDAPIVFNTLKSQLWKPENFGEDYLGDITLRNALAQSRNVVTIRVLDVIGLDPVYKLARRLGIESPMEVDLSMGLGSGSLTMPELARAYSAFATLGKKVDPHTIARVLDRDGQVLEEWTPTPFEQVLDPNVAGITSWLLQEVASNGTAAKAQRLGLHVAGKTGTTNEFHDAWFVGYTAEVLTAVWVGYDQPKSLGSSSTGGYTSLPIWMDYMAVAVPKAADKGFPAPPNVNWVSIDEKTGRPMQNGRSMPFLPGTAPSGVSAAAGQKTSEDLLTSEF